MLGTDGRTLRIAWTVFLFALLAILIYEIRETLVIFTLAIFLAHLLGPVVDRVHRMLRDRIPRTLSLAIVYVVFVGAGIAILIAIGTKIGEQASALAAQLPAALKQDPLGNVPLPSWLEQFRPSLNGLIQSQAAKLDITVLSVARGVGLGILSGLTSLLPVILIPILSFFFLKDGRTLLNGLVALVPERNHELAEGILADLHVLVAQYIRALVLLAIVSFGVNSVVLSILGVPYALLLASIAGILEIIPVVGPITSAVVILLVAVLTGYPHLLWIALFLIVFRLFQDYVVSPHLMSKGVEIHPLLVLFGVLAGEQIAGIGGMFFSVPVMAALRIILVRLRKQSHA